MQRSQDLERYHADLDKKNFRMAVIQTEIVGLISVNLCVLALSFPLTPVLIPSSPPLLSFLSHPSPPYLIPSTPLPFLLLYFLLPLSSLPFSLPLSSLSPLSYPYPSLSFTFSSPSLHPSLPFFLLSSLSPLSYPFPSLSFTFSYPSFFPLPPLLPPFPSLLFPPLYTLGGVTATGRCFTTRVD